MTKPDQVIQSCWRKVTIKRTSQSNEKQIKLYAFQAFVAGPSDEGAE